MPKTSSAAPATFPERSASSSASSSRSSPRAAFTIRTPSACCANASAPIEPQRLGRQRQVQREEVGGREHVLRRLGVLGAELAVALAGDVGVVGHDAHAEPDRAPCDLLADAAEAEHAERLVGELDARPAASAPSGRP